MEKFKKFKINFERVKGGSSGMGLEKWTPTEWTNTDETIIGADMYSGLSGTVIYF